MSHHELDRTFGRGQTALVELVNRVLDKGVVVAGEVTIALADIDLLYLDLNLLLSAVETLRERGHANWNGVRHQPTWERHEGASAGNPPTGRAKPESASGRVGPGEGGLGSAGSAGSEGSVEAPHPAGGSSAGAMRAMAGPRIDADPADPGKGLGRLVLTLVEFIRRTLEHQSLRRMEGGGLDAAEEERLGLALLRLRESVDELKEVFDLEDEDLNFDLGPLGNLL